jgi:beta-exotoxin I transport system permease protein
VGSPSPLAFASLLVNGLLPFNDTLAGWARAQPFHYYLTSDPLLDGMDWGHAAVLAGATVVLVVLSVPLFRRRDLRHTG